MAFQLEPQTPTKKMWFSAVPQDAYAKKNFAYTRIDTMFGMHA